MEIEEQYKAEQKKENDALKALNKINFNTNKPEEICTILDELLSTYGFSSGNGGSPGLLSAYRTKIRFGILNLKRLGESESAAHYESELKELDKKRRNNILIMIIVAIVCLAGLAIIGFLT